MTGASNLLQAWQVPSNLQVASLRRCFRESARVQRPATSFLRSFPVAINKTAKPLEQHHVTHSIRIFYLARQSHPLAQGPGRSSPKNPKVPASSPNLISDNRSTATASRLSSLVSRLFDICLVPPNSNRGALISAPTMLPANTTIAKRMQPWVDIGCHCPAQFPATTRNRSQSPARNSTFSNIQMHQFTRLDRTRRSQKGWTPVFFPTSREHLLPLPPPSRPLLTFCGTTQQLRFGSIPFPWNTFTYLRLTVVCTLLAVQ